MLERKRLRVIKTQILVARKTIKVMRGIQEDSESEDYISLIGPWE